MCWQCTRSVRNSNGRPVVKAQPQVSWNTFDIKTIRQCLLTIYPHSSQIHLGKAIWNRRSHRVCRQMYTLKILLQYVFKAPVLPSTRRVLLISRGMTFRWPCSYWFMQLQYFSLFGSCSRNTEICNDRIFYRLSKPQNNHKYHNLRHGNDSIPHLMLAVSLLLYYESNFPRSILNMDNFNMEHLSMKPY